jgi:tubulin polyglutamylase TTLL6/13
VEPHLVAFMYADGLGRFATEAYSAPKTNEACQNLFVHLTNYAINKNSEKFTTESEGEFKKQLKELYEYFASEGHDVE